MRQYCSRWEGTWGHLALIRLTKILLQTPTAAHLRLDRPIMSTAPTAPSTSTSRLNFVSIFNAALESYKRKTKKDLTSHPLLPSLQACESPQAVLTVLRDQVPALTQLQSCDDRHTKWVTPTVNVLYSFSETIGQGIGLVNIKTFRRREFLP